MGKINETIWDIEPHTEAKHTILRKYLDAWIPIISQWAPQFNIIDGFAGPGEYKGKQEGSPIIVIKSIIGHRVKIKSKVKLLFIENDPERFEFLKSKLNNIPLPPNVEYGCECNDFVVVMNGHLDNIANSHTKLAPTFVFIDPFGFKDIPFSLISKIMNNDSCEVLITFMYEEVNRFVDEPRLENTYNQLYGTEEWKNARGLNDPKERFEVLHNAYMKQLRTIAKYVRSF